MVFPKPPEVTDHLACLDDASIAVDGSASAHALRETARNSNLMIARGPEMFRWMGRADVTYGSEDFEGGAWGFGLPEWHKIIPTPNEGWQVNKPVGLTRMRAALRIAATAVTRFDFQVATIARAFQVNRPASELLSFSTAGGGVSERFVKNDFPLDPGHDELLDFYLRGTLDPRPGSTAAGDALLDTATYGGKSNGTVSQIFGDYFLDTTTTWNATGNQVHRGGHYVYFTAAGDGRPLLGPLAIIDVHRGPANIGQGLVFLRPPEARFPRLGPGATYSIRKLPEYRIESVVGAAVDRSL